MQNVEAINRSFIVPLNNSTIVHQTGYDKLHNSRHHNRNINIAFFIQHPHITALQRSVHFETKQLIRSILYG